MRSQLPTLSSPVLRRRSAVLVGATLALGLAACGAKSSTDTAPGTATTSGAEASTPSSAPAESASPSASAQAATSESPLAQEDTSQDVDVPWLTEASEGTPSGDAGVETDLRWASHEGYDRVVIETSGDSAPGWWATFTPSAATQGKGEAIEVSGTYVLQVIGRGTQMPITPELQEVAYTGYGLHEVGGSAVTQVWVEGTFEDQFQVVLGTTTQEYRVLTLTSPSRLVIDVKQP